MGNIANNLTVVRERIARSAERSGRAAQSVRLVAVTKTLTVEGISEAIQAGVTEFGENRVQEAAQKYGVDIGAVKLNEAGLTLHLIGSLQRNKARQAAGLFDYIQSIDRPEIVKSLAAAYDEREGDQKLPVLIQVDLTGEESKAGVSPANLPGLVDAVLAADNLQGTGLMTIARLGADEGELRHTFSTLRFLLDGLRRSHGLDWLELSMGMSNDYEFAIEEGATMVRLGRILFGEREV